MAQDFMYLNKWTIKNNHPLPLILDIVENIGAKKVFTKLDLQQGYNNIQIKKEVVTRNYWELGVTKYVGKYIDGCNLCQRMKNKIETPVGKLKLSEVLEKL